MKKITVIFLTVIIVLSLICGYASGTQVDREQLKTQMDEYITSPRWDEIIDEIINIWSGSATKTRVLEYESLPEVNGKITMAPR